MVDHIAQVCQRALELPAIDGLGRFAGVFEGNTEVGAVSTGRFAWFNRGGCVANLHEEERISWRIRIEKEVVNEMRMNARDSARLGVSRALNTHDDVSQLRGGNSLPS